MATLNGNAFNIAKIENVVLEINEKDSLNFFVTSFNIPGISIGTIPIANPFKEHNEPSNKLSYNELELSIIVDEDFQSWQSIYDWIKEGSSGYTFSSKDITRASGNIILMTNNMNPKYRIFVKNMFPTTLGSVEIDIQQAEPVPPTFQATFQYESYSFENI